MTSYYVTKTMIMHQMNIQIYLISHYNMTLLKI